MTIYGKGIVFWLVVALIAYLIYTDPHLVGTELGKVGHVLHKGADSIIIAIRDL